jgi:hypothetical protein
LSKFNISSNKISQKLDKKECVAIETIFVKLLTNNLLHMNVEGLSLVSERKQEYQNLPLLFNIVLEVVAKAIRKSEEIKDIHCKAKI